MLEAQQKAIDKNPRTPFYNLNIDAGALWARRMIRPSTGERARARRLDPRASPPSKLAMPEAIEWRRRLTQVRDLSPDIRLFEVEPAGQFVPPALAAISTSGAD